MSSTLIAILALIAIVGVALIIVGQRRTRTLRDKFGSEYDRTLKSTKDRSRAESELAKREERVEQLNIQPLSAADRTRFEQSWLAAQARFVDDPRGAVKEADVLVAEVMRARGYPVADFEQRAADVSVDHPDVVSEYRFAHDIAQRDASGKANTDDLRKAIVHYRALFQDLLVTDTSVADRPVSTSAPIIADRAAPTSGELAPARSDGQFKNDRIVPDRDDARPDNR
jgi:hypothetical protein